MAYYYLLYYLLYQYRRPVYQKKAADTRFHVIYKRLRSFFAKVSLRQLAAA